MRKREIHQSNRAVANRVWTTRLPAVRFAVHKRLTEDRPKCRHPKPENRLIRQVPFRVMTIGIYGASKREIKPKLSDSRIE